MTLCDHCIDGYTCPDRGEDVVTCADFHQIPMGGLA